MLTSLSTPVKRFKLKIMKLRVALKRDEIKQGMSV